MTPARRDLLDWIAATVAAELRAAQCRQTPDELAQFQRNRQPPVESPDEQGLSPMTEG